MRAASKFLRLSIILPLIVFSALGSVYYQNRQNPQFDYQKYLKSVKQLKMKIGVAREKWKRNNPITVSVYLTNKSKGVVKIPDPFQAWYKYQISVIDEKNQQVPMTESTKRQLKMGSVSVSSQELNPKETVEDKVRISDIFELNQKGTYKIAFKRQVGIADKVQHELTSNTITISVVE